jgi:hypothetical protein
MKPSHDDENGPGLTVRRAQEHYGCGQVGTHRCDPTSHEYSVRREDSSVSGLWTPSGEFEPVGDTGAASPEDGNPPVDEAAMREEIAQFQAQLAATPAIDVIANHAVGLFELARLQLALAAEGPEDAEGRMARIAEARLCCDAFAGLVDAIGNRLGENLSPLREGLTQLRAAILDVEQLVRDQLQ